MGGSQGEALCGRVAPVLARRAHKKEGWGGRAARCARAPRTQDLLVPGLGGWSAGYPLLFRLQRVMTRAIGDQPGHPCNESRFSLGLEREGFASTHSMSTISGGQFHRIGRKDHPSPRLMYSRCPSWM